MNLTNLLEPFQVILNEKTIEIEALNAEKLSLLKQIDALLTALKEAKIENTELEENFAELNSLYGSTPEEIKVDQVNTLLQEAVNTESVKPRTPVIPMVETIDSIIARSLIIMDQGNQPRISTHDMLDLHELRHRWITLNRKE